MKNYQCIKCKTVVQSENTPNQGRCPIDPKVNQGHAWYDLGKVGSTNFQCKKCGTVVQSDGYPNQARCPADPKINQSHNWIKL